MKVPFNNRFNNTLRGVNPAAVCLDISLDTCFGKRLQAARGGGVLGFTLVELMVVLAIVAILMAIALPDFVKATRGIQLQHEAKEMAAAIKFTRAEALRRGVIVAMCRSNATQTACNTGSPSSQWENGWLVFTDLNNNGKYDATDALLQIKQALPNGTTVYTQNGATSNFMAFNGAGEASTNLANVGTFRFSHKSFIGTTTNDMYLIIDRVGRVRILNDEQCMLANSGCLEP